MGIVIRRESFARLQEAVLVALVEGARDQQGKVPYLSYADMQPKLDQATKELLAAVCPYPFVGVNDETPGYPMDTEYKGVPRNGA
jgi:hypothetical protein